MIRSLACLAISLVALATTPSLAQPIVVIDYRPPETVQRVAIPVNPAEKWCRC